MQETRTPDGEHHRETFGPGTDAELAQEMDERLTELAEEGHKLVQRRPLTMPGALEFEVERVQALLDAGGTNFTQAGMRSALNEARDTLGKFTKLQKRVLRSYATLKDIK